MSGSFCDYMENKILNDYFGSGTPAILYLALSTTTPTDAGGNVTEPSGGSYARKAVTNNSTNFPSTSNGVKYLHTTQAFVTSTGSWGTVTHVVVYDDPTAGNAAAWADLTTPRTVETGTTLTIAVDAISFTQT